MTYPHQTPRPWNPGPPPGRFTPGYPEAPTIAPSGEPLARFSDRLLARLIDCAILTGVGLVFEIPLLVLLVMTIDNAVGSATAPDASAVVLPFLGIVIAIMVISLLASYLYEVELLLRTGQTIGKRVMNLRVVPLDGTPLTRTIALKRWLSNVIVSMFVPLYGWVDGLWQLIDKPLRQCLHDKVAVTVVVRTGLGKGSA